MGINPQLMDGYIKIANSIWDAIERAGLTRTEGGIVDLVIRLSYGCNQKWCKIPHNGDICSCAHVGRGQVKKILDELVRKRILYIDWETRMFAFNKHYDAWVIGNDDAHDATLATLLRVNLSELDEEDQLAGEKLVLSMKSDQKVIIRDIENDQKLITFSEEDDQFLITKRSKIDHEVIKKRSESDQKVITRHDLDADDIRPGQAPKSIKDIKDIKTGLPAPDLVRDPESQKNENGGLDGREDILEKEEKPGTVITGSRTSVATKLIMDKYGKAIVTPPPITQLTQLLDKYGTEAVHVVIGNAPMIITEAKYRSSSGILHWFEGALKKGWWQDKPDAVSLSPAEENAEALQKAIAYRQSILDDPSADKNDEWVQELLKQADDRINVLEK